MAGTIMHLVVADRLLEHLKIENISLFYCGNLAPDAIMSGENYEREMKRHTHFKDGVRLHDFHLQHNQEKYRERLQKFYDDFVRNYTEKRDLYLGYITHLLVDELYILEFRDRYVKQLSDEGREPSDPSFFELYGKDVDQVDWELVRKYTFHYPMPDILNQENEYEIPGLISNLALRKSKQFIIHKNFEMSYERKELQILSLDENIDFIEMCVKRIPNMLMELEKRNKIHFTPMKGWINDPNGLIQIDGKYHMFYQHYPQDTKWGPMHWGHAVSTDLIHWEHLPIALFPTEEEYIFSGSAILDKKNKSGLGGDKGPLLLFYTAHNPMTGEQMQCMAYSLDDIHFSKYDGNPVIANSVHSTNYKKDFRDPKVFENKVKGGYSMVLAVNDAIEFYSSEDVFHWQFTGAFYPGDYGLAGLCECPDFFSLEHEGEEKYILSMSMIYKEDDAEEERHVMQYFVGSFDGDCFVNEQLFQKNQRLDFGEDNYAMVSFSNSDKLIMMGWGEDWNAARRNHQYYYFGKMTLAREVSLCKIGEKYRLKQKPIVKIEHNTDDVWEIELLLKEGEMAQISRKGEVIQTTTKSDERVALCIKVERDTLTMNQMKVFRELEGECRLHAIYDCGYIELFADDGVIVFSKNS